MKKILFVAMAVMMVMASSCTKQKETATTFKTNEALEAVNVKVNKVEARNVAQLVEFTSTVTANKVQNVAPQAPMRIRKINVEVGDNVKAGQVLVELDMTNLSTQKLQLDNAKVELDRVQRLFNAGGASQSALDQATTQYNVLNNQYNNLLENAQLKSPISGVVTARNYDAGDLYGGQPVLVVQQMNTVKLLLSVNEQYYKDVKVGMPIENISLDAFPGETFRGRVSIVHPTVDESSRTFNVEVKIENNERVRPGMFARVTLNFGEVNRVLAPDQSIVKQAGSGERYVYVVEGGKAYRRTIELGRRIGDQYEIISGINSGDVVVVFGQNLLTDGRDVNVL
ncbi:MAG: efflux RND transporter periplasmic adaptor subunit [Bacteroidales bacterium]|nr:efflux RND transporter periplasmic adaptor subunit [Bacteroidales bacterium]